MDTIYPTKVMHYHKNSLFYKPKQNLGTESPHYHLSKATKTVNTEIVPIQIAKKLQDFSVPKISGPTSV